MKILLIHNKYQQPGGENVVFESEGELLSNHGHSVEQLTFDNSTIKTFFDCIMSGLRGIYNTKSADIISRKIELFAPDIIHVHNFFPLVSPSIFFTAKKYDIPVIHTLHNYRLICPSAFLFHKGKIYDRSLHAIFPMDAIFKRVYRNSRIHTAAVAIMMSVHTVLGTWRNKVDIYIALSSFAKNIFKNSPLRIREERLIVKHNSIQDLGVGESTRDNFLLFAGRLSEEKGVQSLLRATRLHNFKLVIIGDGPLRNLVIDEAKRNSNIVYAGFQDRIGVANYMKKCKALLFPSLWFEGFPLTVLEAFSTSTLVIASKLGVMKEMIQNEENGLLFEAGDERALVDKIIEIDAKPEWAKRLASNGRLSYLTHFTPEKNYDMLIRIYNKALALKRQEQGKLFHHPVPVLGHS